VESDSSHPIDENPEKNIGEIANDPWDDSNQTDWPTNIVKEDN